MPRKTFWLLLAPLAYFLYFFKLSGFGMMGPDEPRYSSIGRAMAQSGDWITPRLWGQPWFEKPALLYWMTATGFKLGLGPEMAPRLPVALLSVAFLAFYWWILHREFGCRAANFAVLILGTSAAWIGFSQVAVTDLPLTAAFSAAMLLALPWISKRDTRYLPAAAAMLGIAALAKGLVPLALAAPLVMRARHFRDLLRPRVWLPFLVIALPWYLLCYARNGAVFPYEFFIVHHLGRFTSDALKHSQPWWFYLPCLLGLLLPWTPLIPLAARRAVYRDPRRVFLLAWFLFGLVLFSASANKLPGYILPLLPAAAALLALALDETPAAGPWLAACALVLAIFPVMEPIFPAAAANEWSHAPRAAFHATCLLALGVAAAAWQFDRTDRRVAAVLCIASGMAFGVVYLKMGAEPALERVASARLLWRQLAPQAQNICVEYLKRDWRYGLNYYSGVPLPDCSAQPKPWWLTQPPGGPPVLTSPPAADGTRVPAEWVDRGTFGIVPSPFQD